MDPLSGSEKMMWSALILMSISACWCTCMAMTTVPANVCIEDVHVCRYQCAPEEVQKYCSSSANNEIDKGFCCPGYFRTNTSPPKCQVCNDVQFMPDVNNCCGCLPCTECDNIVNDTIAVYCSLTSNVVCRIQDDTTPIATSSCPLMEPTTESPTSSEAVTTPEAIYFTSATPREPQESKQTSLEIFLFVIAGLFFLILVLLCAVCICCCCVYKSAGDDQPDVAYTWKYVTLTVANKVVSTCRGFKNTCKAGNGDGAETSVVHSDGGAEALMNGEDQTCKVVTMK